MMEMHVNLALAEIIPFIVMACLRHCQPRLMPRVKANYEARVDGFVVLIVRSSTM
jgi:hypothetical protein